MDSHYSKEVSQGQDFCEPEPLNQIPPTVQNNKNRLQYEQYKKIYLTSYLLYREKERLHSKVLEIDHFLDQIQITRLQATQKLEEIDQENQSGNEANRKSQKQLDRPKRMRRKAEQISRSWECKQDYCGKKYGAHASLLQHVKLKHPSVLQKYF